MIEILATEDEVATLEQFLLDHGVQQECTQSHPLCFLLARMLKSDGNLIPQRVHEKH